MSAPPTPVVLGLDRSRDRLGWGVATMDTGTPLACGVIDLAIIGADGFDSRRPTATAEAVRSLRERADDSGWLVACVFIEAPYVGRSGTVTVDLAMAVGATWQAVATTWPGAPVEFLAPSEWKRAAGVPADPRDGRRTLRGRALRDAVADELVSAGYGDIARSLNGCRLAGLKPWPMAHALMLGFRPNGRQDAADAGLIAVAGQRVNAERWERSS